MPSPPRLSRKQARALELLVSGGESYGLELARASNGDLKRGTIYVTLDRMEERGLVESRLEAPPPGHRGPARRKYKPTGLGETALKDYVLGLAAGFGGLRLASFAPLTLAVPLGTPGGLVFALAVAALCGVAALVYRAVVAARWSAEVERYRRDHRRALELIGWADKATSHDHLPNSSGYPVVFREVLREIPVDDAISFERIRLLVCEAAIEREPASSWAFLRQQHGAISAGIAELERIGLYRETVYVRARRHAQVEGALMTWSFLDFRDPRSEPSATSTLVRGAPGASLVAALRAVFPRSWVERRILPVRDDELTEYIQDLEAGDTGHARWVHVRMHLRIARLMVVLAVGGLLGHVLGEISRVLRGGD